ncbi:BTB/POZ domain-containing protein 9-like, partial [Contarinia nasturtii]|uniref:BTB/POZ domain-containing protein 9-like n=1 Tax=Contarinia nasturtii TaxID=265458 RepID=UPI0012D449EF
MATHENGELDLSGEVLKTLSDICMKDVHSDVTLIVESTKIPAHKTILSARSPYFQTLFNGDFTEASKDEIELKVPFDAFKEILKYIYVGRLSLINLETELIIDMCKLAEMYNFDALNMAMSKYVLDNISINDCISTLNTACLYSMDKLQTECLKFMDCNSIELLKHEAFKTLSETSLCILLKRDTFYAPEIEIFQAIQSWLIHNPDADAKEAFSLVRLSLMTSEDLLSTVLASNILEKSLLLNVMKDSRSAVPRIPYMRENSERDLATLNIATAKNGAKVICGENPEALLNGNFTNYDFDCGSTYHVINPTIFASPYEYARKFSRHIIVDLGNVNVINFMRILLFDKDTRMYSYRVDTSIDGVQYNPLIDYKENYCRSWRSLYFSPQPVQFIRLVGNYAIGTTHSREGYTEGFFADGEGGWEEFG